MSNAEWAAVAVAELIFIAMLCILPRDELERLHEEARTL